MSRKISHSVYFDSDQWNAILKIKERACALDPDRPLSVAALVRRGVDLVLAETERRLEAIERRHG
jgi:hypothetical protein